jgi:hypothetical protein
MPTIISFCDRAVLIEGGIVLEDGPPQDIDRAYQKVLFHSPKPVAPEAAPEAAPANDRFGSGEGRIERVTVLDADGQPATRLEAGKPFAIEARVAMREAVEDLTVGFLVRTPKGIDLFGVDNTMDDRYEVRAAAGEVAVVRLDGRMNLANGDYFLTVGVARRDGQKIDLKYDAAHFSVVGTERQYTTSLVCLDHRVTVRTEAEGRSAARTDDLRHAV